MTSRSVGGFAVMMAINELCEQQKLAVHSQIQVSLVVDKSCAAERRRLLKFGPKNRNLDW